MQVEKSIKSILLLNGVSYFIVNQLKQINSTLRKNVECYFDKIT